MAKPLVSICIPCFNAASHVGDTLKCVLSQTWSPLEIIVVNDGSSDGSEKVLGDFVRRGVRIVHQRNRGQCAAANRALSLSTGEYIKFLDADDLLSPSFIELQMARLEGRDNAVASAEWGRFYNDDLRTYQLNSQSVWRDMLATDWLLESWIGGQPMMQCGLWLIPRTILERSGGWDESLSLINDFEFFARVLCHTKEVRFTPGARLYYRSGIPGSLSSRKTRAAAESAYHSILKGTHHLLARRCDAEARLSCANVMQNFLYTFYPEHADLRAKMEQRIVHLGGSDLHLPGGPWIQRASRLIGWKAARRLQRAAGRA